MATARTKRIMRASAALFGTIVGAGIFGLPYFVARAGYAAGMFWLVALTGAVTLTHLLYAEVIVATKEKHRLVGYVGAYLGPWAKRIETFTSILGTYGGALAYFILGGLFLSQLLPIGPAIGSYAIFAFVSFLVWRGPKFLAKIDFWLSLGLTAAFLLLIGRALTGLHPEFLAQPIVWKEAFLPYGIVLFALGGMSAVAEIAEVVEGDRASLRASVVIGTCAAAALTALFTTAVVGALGTATSPESVAGLNAIFDGWTPIVGALAGLLAVVTSYVVFSSNLKNQYVDDFRWPEPLALLVTLLVPAGLYFLGVRSFGKVLELVGSVLIGLEGIFVAWMYLAARERAGAGMLRIPKTLIYLLMLVYGAGMVYEFVHKAL